MAITMANLPRMFWGMQRLGQIVHNMQRRQVWVGAFLQQSTWWQHPLQEHEHDGGCLQARPADCRSSVTVWSAHHSDELLSQQRQRFGDAGLQGACVALFPCNDAPHPAPHSGTALLWLVLLVAALAQCQARCG